MNKGLEALRKEMQTRGITAYIIPTADFHESEYVGEHFKCRKYISGFSGSAGTAVVTADEAGLWTDGRYFIQAEKELEGTGFELYRMGEEGVPTIVEFLESHIKSGDKLGFDGRVINSALAMQYKQLVEERGGSLATTEDLVGLVWEDRPALPADKLWILKEEYSGRPVADKLKDIREKMIEQDATMHLVSSLYDIAWILNLRGNDIANVPVFLSFLLIEMDRCQLFIQEADLTDEVKAYLAANNIDVFEYDHIYEKAASIEDGARILMNKNLVNYNIVSALGEGVEVIDDDNPSELMRSIKNETELKNTRIAHLKDGVAITKFMYWLKKNVGKIPMTEYSVSVVIDNLRREQENCIDLSFSDICAYNANAAMMHYSAKENDCAELKPEGLLLLDSGGHYLEGTTDITRTFVLGPISDEIKMWYTAVVRGNLNLANAKFLYGCCGINLDILCREPLWSMAMDYKCGTGHGVGHILNVHEGPQGFRWKKVPERKDSGTFEAGMVTTDEPGVYIEGEFGIRVENELICKKGPKNEYGQFMEFENITYAPIDLDAILPEQMSATERRYLNEYHKNVYEKVAPFLTEEEKEWLKEYTREI